MTGFAFPTKNTMLDVLNGATYASLHTADPGETGAAEVTGGTPAYGRQALMWGPAVDGVKVTTAELMFDVPRRTTITHLGYWSAPTGGTFYGSRPLDPPETYQTQGEYVIDAGSVSERLGP